MLKNVAEGTRPVLCLLLKQREDMEISHAHPALGCTSVCPVVGVHGPRGTCAQRRRKGYERVRFRLGGIEMYQRREDALRGGGAGGTAQR